MVKIKKLFLLFWLIPFASNCQWSSKYVPPVTIQTSTVDAFTATNGTSIDARNTDSGDSWTIANGILVINSNSVNANTTATNCFAWIDKGWTSVILKADITSTTGTDQIGIVLRYVDNNNYYRVVFQNTGNAFRLYQVLAGVETLVTFSQTPIIEAPLYVELNGSSMLARMGGSSMTATLSQFQGATKHGIFLSKPGATNSVTLDNFIMYQYSPSEPPNVASKIVLTSGVNYNAYQRLSNTPGSNKIYIAGRINDASPHDIEASWNGGGFQTIGKAQANGFFTGELTGLGQGQGDLVVRFKDNTPISITSHYVTICDIFYLAGQSNCVGEISAFQTYSGSYRCIELDNQYQWRNLIDPTGSYVNYVDYGLSVASPAAIGSYWPLVATQYMADKNLPIAFITGAAGGTTISQWAKPTNPLDRKTLFGSMIYRIKQQPYGIKGIFWHQGESDATVAGFTGRTTYASRLSQFATDIFNLTGLSILVCRIHTWNTAPSTTAQNVIDINAAMSDAAGSVSTIIIGPDYNNPTSVTTNLHFGTNGEALDAATRFYNAFKLSSIY